MVTGKDRNEKKEVRNRRDKWQEGSAEIMRQGDGEMRRHGEREKKAVGELITVD